MRKFLLAAALALATLLPQRAKASMPGCTAGGSPLYLQVPNAGATGSQWNACMQYDFNKLSTATIANSSTTGSSFSQLVVSTISGNPAGYIYITSNTYFTAPIAVNSSVTASAFFGNSASITDTLLVSNNIGVGAGATSPGSLVDAYNGTTPLTYTGVLKGIAGNFSGLMPVVGQANGDSAILNVASTDTAKAGYGGNIALGGRYTNSNAYVPYAKIAGEKENSVNGHYGGNLVLYTKQSGQGSFSKQAVLDSSGTFNLLNALSATTVLQAAGGASFTGANGNAVAAGSMTASAFFGTTLTANSVTATTYGAVAAVSVAAGPAGTASLTSGSAALSTAYAATVQGGAGIGSNSPGGSVILNTGIGNAGTGQNGGVVVNLNRRDGSNLTGLQAGFVVTGGSTTLLGPLYVSSTTAGGAYILTDSSVTASAFFGNGSGLTSVTGTDSTKLAKAGDTMTGALTMTSAVLPTVTSTFTVANAAGGANPTWLARFFNTTNTNGPPTCLLLGQNNSTNALERNWGLCANNTAHGMFEFMNSASSSTLPSSTLMSIDSGGNVVSGASVTASGFFGNALTASTLTINTNTLTTSGANVGIGLTGASAVLQVRPGTDDNLWVRKFNDVIGGYGTLGISLDSLNNAAAMVEGFGFRGTTIAFQTDGGQKAVILSNGNVGIGTASPDSKLTLSSGTFRCDGNTCAIASTGTYTGTGPNGNIVSASSITTTGSLFGGDLVTNTVHPTNDFVLTAATNKSVYLRPNGTGTLQVDTGSGGYFYAGNWGFGTQTPASKLHMSSGTLTIDGTPGATTPSLRIVQGGAPATPDAGTLVEVSSVSNAYIHITAGTTGRAGIQFGDSGASSMGGIAYNNNTDGLEFSTNGNGLGAPSMKIASNGDATINGAAYIGAAATKSTFTATGSLTLDPAASLSAATIGGSGVGSVTLSTAVVLATVNGIARVRGDNAFTSIPAGSTTTFTLSPTASSAGLMVVQDSSSGHSAVVYFFYVDGTTIVSQSGTVFSATSAAGKVGLVHTSSTESIAISNNTASQINLRMLYLGAR